MTDTSHMALRDYLVLHYDELKRRLARHLGCADLAVDSLHDTWLRLDSARCADAIQNPRAYVYRMACNAATDRIRADRLHPDAGDGETLLDNIADSAPGPADIAESRSDLRALMRVMERLPMRRREILLEVRLEEQPQRDVALRHGISLRLVERELQQSQGYCVERMR